MVDRCPGAAADRDLTAGHRLGARLEHRGVDDPGEGEGALVDQSAPPADLEPGGTEQRATRLGGAGTEEDAVARPCPDLCGQAGLLLLGDVLGDRTGELAVLLHQHVGESPRAALLRPLLPGVELLARLARAAW